MVKVFNPDLIIIANNFCALKTILSPVYCVQKYIFFLFITEKVPKNNKKAVISFPLYIANGFYETYRLLLIVVFIAFLIERQCR